MEWIGSHLRLSATDLVGHLDCRHLSKLNRAVARGELAKPFVHDPMLEVLRERGARHEAEYVAHLEAQGLPVTTIGGLGVDTAAIEATLAAMREGAPVIVQAALASGQWGGRADVLLRVDAPSGLGTWAYEPVDAKLARETQAGAVLQLSLYAELLEAAQGVAPEHVHVVAPWSGFTPRRFRVADYGAYFRRAKADLEAHLADSTQADTYPDPVEHCAVCRWRQRCDARRRDDDHLSLVAGIRADQIKTLRARGVATTAALAALPVPLAWKPERGARGSYERVREQARLQVAGREAGQILHELLPCEDGVGLARLPEPSPGDIFLDLEGDAFVGQAGLEYLFGYAWRDDDGHERYTGDWALSRADERAAFERFVDFAIARLERWPELHIYHYAPYEPGAMRRLMGRYATREDEVDRLLRAQIFIDLYAVVRGGVRASVESYSIKRLEPLFAFERDAALPDANRALAALQGALELGDTEGVTAELRVVVEAYNRDDCYSAWRLRDWLELRRAELEARGVALRRPEAVEGDANEDITAWLARIRPIMDTLLAGVPDDVAERSPEQHGRWLLANMLDWHRRERKASAWEYFRLRDLSPEDLMEERGAVAGLVFEGVVPGGPRDRVPTHRYRFPPQELDLRDDVELHAAGGGKVGALEEVSADEGWLDIKKTGKTIDVHPEAVFAQHRVGQKELEESLLRLGEYVAAHGLEGDGAHRPARALLLRAGSPGADGPLQRPDETPLEAALRLVQSGQPAVLPIQGPPGAGKTFTGAELICALALAGRKIGVTANSHAVIRNLLDEVLEAAKRKKIVVECVQKPKTVQDDISGLRFVARNDAVYRALAEDCQVAGGTAWLWAPQEAAGQVDVLVVDEAAQMSLANVLAVAQAANTIVLLGDPQQLDQPLQGSHPDGTDASALHHVLCGAKTMAPEQGLFLAETWRLRPGICDFTSELFYEGRLTPKAGLEAQVVRGAGPLSGHGMRYAPVSHAGNRNASAEEAELIASLVQQALAGRPTWVDGEGKVQVLTLDDILIITPYNAQIAEIRKRLPNARVGTVDKFQGQQAAVVIYSMASSSPADAPRGMDFLYSLNRLNVATSRARSLCLVVASPALLQADCRTPVQMQLVNALCRYVELAIPIPEKIATPSLQAPGQGLEGTRVEPELIESEVRATVGVGVRTVSRAVKGASRA